MYILISAIYKNEILISFNFYKFFKVKDVHFTFLWILIWLTHWVSKYTFRDYNGIKITTLFLNPVCISKPIDNVLQWGCCVTDHATVCIRSHTKFVGHHCGLSCDLWSETYSWCTTYPTIQLLTRTACSYMQIIQFSNVFLLDTITCIMIGPSVKIKTNFVMWALAYILGYSVMYDVL